MKAMLKRDVIIKKFDIVADISSPSSNGEVVLTILNDISLGNNMLETFLDTLKSMSDRQKRRIVESIYEYIRKLGLIDQKGLLTKKGNSILKGGQLFDSERGLYTFHGLNDKLTGRIPVAFERRAVSSRYRNNNKTEKSELPFEEGEIYLNVLTGERFELINLYSNSSEEITSKAVGEINAQLILNFDNSYANNYKVFLVNSEYTEKKESLIIQNVDYLNKFIVNLVQMNDENLMYDEKLKMFIVKDSALIEAYNKKICKKNVEVTGIIDEAYGQFDNSKIDDIVITPSNYLNAKEWLFNSLKLSCDSFMTKAQFRSSMINTISESSYTRFRDELHNIKVDEFAGYLKLNGYNENYWEVQSTLDLDPGNLDFALDNIHMSNDIYSMSEIATKIVNNISPEKLVVFSRYLSKPSQQKKISLFVDSFIELGTTENIVVTNEYITFSNDKIETIVNDKWTHDRHFCFKSEGKWYFYKMTGEFDQCWYTDVDFCDWNTKTSGRWEELSILKIEKEYFPKRLIEIINRTEGVTHE